VKKIEISDSFEVLQDREAALVVLGRVGQWMLDSGKNPSKYWHPDNMHSQFFKDKNVDDNDFYAAMVDGKPVAAQILEWSQKGQDWSCIDKGPAPPSLYLSWLCVDRDYAGQGLPKLLIDFSARSIMAEQPIQDKNQTSNLVCSSGHKNVRFGYTD